MGKRYTLYYAKVFPMKHFFTEILQIVSSFAIGYNYSQEILVILEQG